MECGKLDEVASLLAEGKYEEAAEAVEQGVGEAIFHRRVAHTFGERKSSECELQGASLVLPDLASGPVVTTNFDRILERVFAEAGKPFEHISWGSQVDSMRQALAENRPFLLKIHGDAEERCGRVLTKSEYDTCYAPGDPENLRAQIGRALQARTLLFVGCSLAKDRTMDVVTEVSGQASGLLHFAIVEKPASDDAFFARQQWLGNRGVLPIWYPTGRHVLIEPLLRWIASLQPVRWVAGTNLVLERRSHRKTEIRSELDLLIPYQRTTAFVGREADLEGLRAWVLSDPRISVRVVTGDGGSGKTRLAIELLDWLTATDPAWWDCGFLTRQEIERFSALQNLSRWRPRKHVLAVVDYAAGTADRLRVWLEQLAGVEFGEQKLRLLLLERQASLDVGWLSSMIPRGHSAASVRSLFDPLEPVRLRAVADVSDRRSVLQATLDAGGALRGIAALVVPAAGLDRVFDREIEEPRWGDPLTLMIAGLTALDNGLPAAMALGRVDLAFRLADRELDRIGRFGRGAPVGLMEHMAAYVAISGGLSRGELGEAAKRESDAIGRRHPGGWAVLADSICEALRSGDGTRLAGPGVVGEALLLRVWGGSEVREGCNAVVRAAKAHGRRAVASVMRAAQDFCVGETPYPEPLEWLDALIASSKDDLAILWQIDAELPPRTIALRERAVVVDVLMAAVLRASCDQGVLPELSRVLNNLGVSLTYLGRHEEALRAADEAARMSRQLAAGQPDGSLPALAIALDNLGNALSFVGRSEDALKTTDEAVQIYRQLAAQAPGAFLKYLGRSLNNLSSRFTALHRPEEALNAAEGAVGIHRQFGTEPGEAPLPDLASSLTNLGIALQAIGRPEDALRAADESVQIFRQLSAQHPDAFLRKFAAALVVLRGLLSVLGRDEEAIRATEETSGVCRQMRTCGDAFLPDLARSLGDLSLALLGLGRSEEALKPADEAVRIYRQLTAKSRETFLPGLARSLNNLGYVLRGLKRREEALELADEAVRTYRQLAAISPEAFLPELALSLNNFGGFLRELGRPEEALKPCDEAVRIYRNLRARSPNTLLSELAGALDNGGICLRELGRFAEAFSATQEAVQLYRQIAEQIPGALLPDYAIALNNLSICLKHLGPPEKWFETTHELIGIRRQLAAKLPDPPLSELAGSLNIFGDGLRLLGRSEEASQAATEAVDIYRKLAAQQPDAFLPNLASALDNLGSSLGAMRRHEEATRAVEEAVAIGRQLAAPCPETVLPAVVLATSLATKAEILDRMGNLDAGPVSRDAVACLKPAFLRRQSECESVMRSLVYAYAKACAKAGAELDLGLLGDVLPRLADQSEAAEL